VDRPLPQSDFGLIGPLSLIGFLALLLVTPVPCLAAGGTSATNDAVSRARAMEKDHRAEALKLLEERLTEDPADSDARTLHGIVLSWEGRYDDARLDLRMVLTAHPGHKDALAALINVELWSDHPAEAEKLARSGLDHDGRNPDLLLLRAKALKAMLKLREAHEAAKIATQIDPGNRGAAVLRESLADSLRPWLLTLTHTSDWFSDGRTPWREDQLALSHAIPAGKMIARFSDATRFGDGSRQTEIDYYPHLRPGSYAYLNAGYSPDAKLYPRYRAAADIFQSIGHGFEVTAGYRRLAFGTGVNIYTAAATKYHGNWMLTGRTYLTPDSIGTSHSVQITLRRYFGDGQSYCTVRGGWGSSPAESNNVTDIGILSSRAFAAEFAHGLSRRLSFLMQGGVSQQDRINITGLYDVTLSANFYFHF
jgi:YaiO family outer membrane protein